MGNRPANGDDPGGQHDGTFVQDFEFVEGSGDLDECNGRFGVTPEYPDGIYYYVLTDAFPFVPRMFRGTPNESFSKQAVDRDSRFGPDGERRRGFRHGLNEGIYGPPPHRPPVHDHDHGGVAGHDHTH